LGADRVRALAGLEQTATVRILSLMVSTTRSKTAKLTGSSQPNKDTGQRQNNFFAGLSCSACFARSCKPNMQAIIFAFDKIIKNL